MLSRLEISGPIILMRLIRRESVFTRMITYLLSKVCLSLSSSLGKIILVNSLISRFVATLGVVLVILASDTVDVGAASDRYTSVLTLNCFISLELGESS